MTAKRNFDTSEKNTRQQWTDAFSAQTYFKGGASVLIDGRAGSWPHESWPHSSLPRARCWFSLFATTNNNIPTLSARKIP